MFDVMYNCFCRDFLQVIKSLNRLPFAGSLDWSENPIRFYGLAGAPRPPGPQLAAVSAK